MDEKSVQIRANEERLPSFDEKLAAVKEYLANKEYSTGVRSDYPVIDGHSNR